MMSSLKDISLLCCCARSPGHCQTKRLLNLKRSPRVHSAARESTRYSPLVESPLDVPVPPFLLFLHDLAAPFMSLTLRRHRPIMPPALCLRPLVFPSCLPMAPRATAPRPLFPFVPSGGPPLADNCPPLADNCSVQSPDLLLPAADAARSQVTCPLPRVRNTWVLHTTVSALLGLISEL